MLFRREILFSASLRMKKVGWLWWGARSYNMCARHGRVFNFAANQGKLVVSELFLGDEVRVKEVNTGVDCKCNSSRFFSSCLFGDKILVMVGKRNATDFFCALVSVDPGELTKASIHIDEKKVIGWESYRSDPYLVQISENKVWVSFDDSNEIWIEEIKGDELVMTKHPDQLPVEEGFNTVPLRLADDRFLAAGGCPSSTDITLITPGEHFSFEKIGDMPGEGKDGVSTILIEERFVVGFGGWNMGDVNDLWIFDLQTHKASGVAKEGEWHPAVSRPFLTIKDGILYILSGEDDIAIHSITLQCLSELIQDLDIQEGFQRELSLELRRYPVVPQKARELRGMCDLGGYFYEYRSYNTVDHQGRAFHFFQQEGKFCVTEIFFGPWWKTRTVNTYIDCKTDDSDYISCCPLGDNILVMAGKQYATEFFCALVGITSGVLDNDSIHIEEKRVVGLEEWKGEAYLVQIAENKVWISFDDSDEIWIGELKGDDLVMTKHSDHLPTEKGFGATPLRLPDGRLLAAGGCPSSTDITLIVPGERFSFEKIGDMPGEWRYCVSIILVKGRFLVGFGGNDDRYMDEMWIFDLQTHRASAVAKEGNWHPGGWWPFLTVKEGVLYIAGDERSAYLHLITLQHLSGLIQDLDLQPVFQTALDLELRRYPDSRTDNGEFEGMRDLGGCFPDFFTHNTVDHQGRVFHFFPDRKKLCVTEVFIGPCLKTRTVNTGIDCKTDDDKYVSCCSFGEQILVMARERYATEFFCALVSIDPGELSRESIHIEEKRVVGLEEWEAVSYLVQIAENKVWISFDDSDEIWIGELKGDDIVMTKHSDQLPTKGGFGAPPFRLPDGKLLAAERWAYSTNINLITVGEHFSFEKVGDMPGEERYSVSTILIKERFVVGFGEQSRYMHRNDPWIFDLETGKASPVAKGGEWHPGDPWPFLVVRNDTLYLLDGSAHSLSFTALTSLIQDATMRFAFISTCTGSDHASPSQLVKPQSLSPYSPSAPLERQRIAEFGASLKEKEAEIQTRDQKISQLEASLAESHGNLTEATEAVRKSNSQVASLTKERDKVKERLALLEEDVKTQKIDAESLRSELRARDDQLAKLQEEVKRLKENQVPPGSIVIRLPSLSPPHSPSP